MSKTAWIILVIVVIVIIGGIYWFSTQNTSTPATTSTTASSTGSTLVLGSDTQFPSYLEAGNGMALYTFSGDTSGVSNCTGSCAAAWPPYTASSASGLTAGANIPGVIGTITRSDGTLQVTYNGMPLYFFAQDSSVGEVTGNGQGGFAVAMATAATGSAATPAATTPTQSAPTTQAPAPAPAPTTPPAYNY